MYSGDPDTSSLRQGDVISGILFPRYALRTLAPLQRWKEDGSFEQSDRAVIDVRSRLAVVVSQCCEFNEDKRNAFTLARLVPLLSAQVTFKLWGFNLAELVPLRKTKFKGKLEPAVIEELRAANRVDPDAEHNKAVNVYLFEPDGVRLTEHHVADFTQVFSINMAEKDVLLRSKLLELDPAHRREFQLKLAYFYGRRAEGG